MDITNKKQKYVVFSNGVVLAGFDATEVTNQLCAIYKMPKDKVSTRLIGGKKRKIRSFDDINRAEQLLAKLTKLGLSCYISSPKDDSIGDTSQQYIKATQEPTQQTSDRDDIRGTNDTIPDDIFAPFNTDENDHRSPWLKWMMLALLLLGLGFAAYYFSSKWVVQEVPTTVSVVEAAMFASQKPSVLIHGDLAQLRRLLSLTDDAELEKKSTTALSKLPLLHTDGDYQALLTATNYITAGASFKDTAKPSNDWLMVLQGDYSNLNVEKELSKLYLIDKSDSAALSLTFRPTSAIDDSDKECPAEDLSVKPQSNNTTYAHLGKSRILLSSTPEMLASFESAFKNKNKLKQPELRQWQDYRDKTLFAISSLDKQLLQKDLMANAASKSLFGDSTFEFIGVRASVSPIAQAIELSFDADMNDNTIAKELASKITDSIDDLEAANSESFPSVIELLSRINVNSDQALHLSLSLDKGLINELESVVSDFFSMIFSPNISQSNDDDNSAPAEELEKYAWDYALNDKVLNQGKLPLDQFTKFHPIAVNGNVSIFMDNIGRKPVSSTIGEKLKALQITIRAKRLAPFGDAFFGWSDSGIKQSLSISDVLDKDGNSLLIDERCAKSSFSQDLNHQTNDNTNYSNGVIDTPKTVRLIDSATPSSIDKIKGRYVLNVPVSTIVKDVSFDTPFIEWQAGSFKLTEIKNGSVAYTLVDDESRLLEIRGLNEKGQALSSTSSFSIDNKHTKRFKGEVASVQLVIAGKLEQQEFEFNIDNVMPKPIKSNTTNAAAKNIAEPILFNRKGIGKFAKALNLNTLNVKDKNVVSRKLNWQNFSIDASKEHELGNATTSSGVVFFKHNVQSNWNHKLSGLVILPHDMSLQSSDSLVSLTLTLDGKVMPPATLSLTRATTNGKPVPTISTDSLNYDTGTFAVPFEENLAPIKKIKGTLEYTLPTNIEVTSIDLSNPANLDNGLTFINYDYGWQGSVSYQLNEALAKAYVIKLSTDDGFESLGKITSDNNISTVEFDKVEGLQKVDFYFIKKAQTITEEFTFSPVYK